MAADTPTGLERITRLEARFDGLNEKVGDLQKDIAHIEAWQENTARTLGDIAGLLRDQKTERRLLSKLAHVLGWIISASIAWFAHGHFNGR